MFRLFFELIRIIGILILLGGLMGALVKLLFAIFGINVDNTNGGWIVGISILILIFVLYRNKFQFYGFYKGREIVKLPKKVTDCLVLCSITMLFIAPFFN
ncbi:hypothetical protein ACIQZG_09220 [Lysinibacillus sp. NPDC096418]|uniref:hypothetical protein n=1 Tax=Lysinibacillus sp. NPDC096418 TaxID=3364138 RepID=UPI00381E0D6D